jgi:hypothetical protein
MRWTPSGSTSRTARRARLVAWLIAHPDLWADSPGPREDVTAVGRALLIRIQDALEREGFYVPLAPHTTPRADRFWALRVLVGVAREEAAAVSLEPVVSR